MSLLELVWMLLQMKKFTKSNMANKDRKGKSINTYNGILFWPLDPIEEEINIEDIAHSLSMQCRFNGHLLKFYSVAEHSVRVAAQCSPENALWGLLHDASEAYCADLPSPLKEEMVKYKEMENKVQQVVCKKFGLPIKEPLEIKKYDIILRVTEMRDLRKNGQITGHGQFKPLSDKIEPWSQEKAKKLFLETFELLTK